MALYFGAEARGSEREGESCGYNRLRDRYGALDSVFRALESERPDATFRDPYARRLAGKRGEDVIRGAPRARASAWGIITRTAVIDDEILNAVREQRVDIVLNLAYGLDTRPFRLALPASLTWFEVDLPEVIAYKQAFLTGEQPSCRLESIGIDLRNRADRCSLFARVNSAAQKTLIVSEGFLLYLPADAVAAIARDFHECERFSYWITDVTSPLLLRMHQVFSQPIQRSTAAMRFAPGANREFFEPCGWNVRRFRPLAVEGQRLHRHPPFAPLLRVGRIFLSAKWRAAFRDSSGVLLLDRVGEPGLDSTRR